MSKTEHFAQPGGAVPRTPQEILRELQSHSRRRERDAAAADPPSQPKPTRKPHPNRTVEKSLRRFIALREQKFNKQTEEGDLLGLARGKRQLAERLRDSAQVEAYVEELKRAADEDERQYAERAAACRSFWYGPDGLAWLGAKKGLEPREWLEYDQFMDGAALRALAALIERDLIAKLAKPSS